VVLILSSSLLLVLLFSCCEDGAFVYHVHNEEGGLDRVEDRESYSHG